MDKRPLPSAGSSPGESVGQDEADEVVELIDEESIEV